MGEIAPEEQFLPLSTIFYYLMLDFYVKTGIRLSLRDKRLFEITEVEITRVNCINIKFFFWSFLLSEAKNAHMYVHTHNNLVMAIQFENDFSKDARNYLVLIVLSYMYVSFLRYVCQIDSLRESLSPTQLSALSNKSKQIQDKMDQQMAALRSGGIQAIKGIDDLFIIVSRVQL